MTWRTEQVEGVFINTFEACRQAEATNSTISVEQIARIRQAIRSTCPNGSRHRLLSLTRDELAALSEMLQDAEARLWAEENARVEDEVRRVEANA